MTNRPRVQSTIAGIAVLGVVVAAAVLLYTSTRPATRSGRADRLVAADSQAAAGSASTVPSFLPAGATVVSTTGSASKAAAAPTDLSGLSPSQLLALVQNVPQTEIGLAGPANADNVTSAGLQAQVDSGRTSGGAVVHPGTDITSIFDPKPHTLTPADGVVLKSVTTSVDGNPGLLTSPVGGDSGTYRVEWNDSAGYHDLEVTRLDTSDGLSGVSLDVLEQMAQSFYSPSN